MSLIEIEHLTYSYPGAENPTLNDISIQIGKRGLSCNRWQQRMWKVHFL